MVGATRSSLVTLAILLHAGMATAYSISIQEVSCGSGPSCSYLPSDILEVDVVLDTEGHLSRPFAHIPLLDLENTHSFVRQ
jgi:hypothetical protein